MAEVNLKIRGNSYGVVCGDGQEDRVRQVATYVDERAQAIAQAGAASNENHLLVLTALMLADEVKDLQDSMSQIQEELEDYQTRPAGEAGMSAQQEQQVLQVIDHLKARVNDLSQRIQAF